MRAEVSFCATNTVDYTITEQITDRERHIFRQVGLLCLIGFSLFAIVFFSPDAGQNQHTSFIKVASASSWGELGDFAAAWCSLKIILLSVGLFLFIESAGTLLAVMRRRHLALTVFLLQAVPLLGFVSGSYCFVKALL